MALRGWKYWSQEPAPRRRAVAGCGSVPGGAFPSQSFLEMKGAPPKGLRAGQG